MVAKILAMIAITFSEVSGWFVAVMNKTGMFGFFIFCFFIYVLCRVILSPLVGPASSDSVKKEKDKLKEDVRETVSGKWD